MREHQRSWTRGHPRYDEEYGTARGRYDADYRGRRGPGSAPYGLDYASPGGAERVVPYGAEYGVRPGHDLADRERTGGGFPPGRRPVAGRRGGAIRAGRRRWPRAFDGAAPEDPPGRRWDDRVPGDRSTTGWRGRFEAMRDPERRRHWQSRSRRTLHRFREPLIGLGIAGAAMPLARAAQEKQPTERQHEPMAMSAAEQAPLPAAGELEEAVGERWAEEEEARVRSQTIEGAVVRYGISPDLAQDIYDRAVEEGIEPDMAYGLVNAESTFRQRAVSHVGARGLTQLMPRTAAWLQPGTSTDDLFDRNTNLRLGFRYLRDLIDKYDGNERLALLAYNRGPGTVDKVLKRGGNPDNGYADKVLRG